MGADTVTLVAGGAFVIFNSLMLAAAVRSGRVPYGWFFFKPLMVSRAENPVGFWFVTAFFTVFVVVIGLEVIRAGLRLAGYAWLVA